MRSAAYCVVCKMSGGADRGGDEFRHNLIIAEQPLIGEVLSLIF